MGNAYPYKPIWYDSIALVAKHGHHVSNSNTNKVIDHLIKQITWNYTGFHVELHRISRSQCQKLRMSTPGIRFDVRELHKIKPFFPKQIDMTESCPKPSTATYITRWTQEITNSPQFEQSMPWFFALYISHKNNLKLIQPEPCLPMHFVNPWCTHLFRRLASTCKIQTL